MNTKNFIISGTNFWNPGDDIVRDGVIAILKKIFPNDFLNFLFYNFNADFFPLDKFSGRHNMLSKNDLKNIREFIDGIIIAGLSTGLEIKDLYNWIIENRLTDRVYLIGAGYENDYVAHYINEEPEKTIFQNAKIIIGRTKKKPSLMDELNLPYFHLNCPSILSVKNVKTISNEQKIKSIVFSIQLPKELGGIINHTCALPMYQLSIELLKELQKNFQIDIIAHHKSEYFHFLNFVKENNYPINVIFSSFYQDLFSIYPNYDLIITTRLHASLFANGFGIPGIIINDTDRHTYCLDGFNYSFWTNNKKNFYEIFNKLQTIQLSNIAEDIKLFKQNLLSNYEELLSKHLIINKKNNDEKINQFKKEKKISNDYKFDSEQKEQLLVRNVVKEGMTVFDVGAHLGEYTKLFSLLVGEKGKVFAFEPTKKSFLELSNSIKENNCLNVKIYNNAVYDRNTKINFNEFPSEYSSWNSLGKPQMENPKNLKEYVPIINSSEVDAISLGDFLDENKIQKIDYLKIDVEGAEIFVLKGLEKYLKQKSINFIQFEISKKMLEGLKTNASDVFNYLNKFDYEVHKIKSGGEIGEIVYDSNEFYENYIAFPSIISDDKDKVASKVYYAVCNDTNTKIRVLNTISQLTKDHWLEQNIEMFKEAVDSNESWFETLSFLNWYATNFKPNNYLEVGVRRGRSMTQVMIQSPETKAYGFDLWIPEYAGVPNPGPEFVLSELKKLGVKNLPILIIGNSHETLSRFWSDPNNPQLFELILVDGDHTYDGAKKDLEICFAHLAAGGALIFDDIKHPNHPQLKDLWEEYKNKFADYIFIENLYGTGTGVAFKPPFNKLTMYFDIDRQEVKDTKPNANMSSYKNVEMINQMTSSLPIHFFTIVLNGQPFIRYHIEIFKQLPFKWYWHIVEGVADLKHDTSWSLNNGGKINSNLHNNGLSKDGTTKYLNKLKKEFPNNIFIYRKPNNKFWNGKLEMVNAPLKNISEECLLWQIDSDELWTSEQIIKMRELFLNNPEKTAAYFYCHYFVGEKLVITTRNTYGNNSSYEWLRVWRFKPNDKWLSHEPPVLSRLVPTQSGLDEVYKNVATINPFIHYQTEINGLVFQHYAYVTEEQLLFKEIYYGYKNALNQWKLLQNNFKFPVLLKNYFYWVNDNSLVNNLNSTDIKALAYKDKFGNWLFRNNLVPTRLGNENFKPKKILFVRTDSIGDNILASSMLKPIKEKYSDAEIIIVCQNHIAEIYSNCPYINKIISFDKKRLYFEETYKNDFLENLKLIKPDLVLNTVYSREPITDLISLNCDAENTVAFIGDNSNIDENLRLKNNIKYSKIIKSDEKVKIELFRYKDFLDQLEIPHYELKPQMWLSQEDEDFAEQFFNENNLSSQNTIAFLPFAQSNNRIYENYDEVIKQFPDYNFIILGSQEFYEQSKILEKKLTNDTLTNPATDGTRINYFNLVGKTTIKQLSAIIKKSSLYLGAETSGAHIACAFNIPNVVLVGGGHFNRFLPYSNLTTIVSLPLECYQCNWDCKYEKAFCVKDIKPIIIINALKNVLKSVQTQLENKSRTNSIPQIFVEGISYWLENYNQEKPVWIDIKKFINSQEVNIIEINDQELLYKNLIKAAEVEIDKNNYVQAKKYLELVLENDNNNIDALNDLTVLEIMNQNWDAAHNLLTKIIQIEPNNEIAKNNLIYFENKFTIYNAILESENLIAEEKYLEAKNLLENILNSEPENLDALNNLSVIEIYLQDYKSAMDYINKILSLEPTNEIAINNLEYLNSLLKNTNQISHSDESQLNESYLINQSNKNKITIATSIAPKNLDKQKIAIQSWIDVGFDVISINTKDEIEFLKQQFNEVKFVEAKRDARNFAERPYIYFDDVMQTLQDSGSEICGIINSDIILNVNSDFYNYIFNLAKDSFVYGSRTDINSLNSVIGNFYEYGFDIFFFNRKIISLFPKSNFCLGLPSWDYWIVIVPLVKNIKLKRIISPIALHLWHETNYNIKYWIELGKTFIDYLKENNYTKFKKIFFHKNIVDQINIISFELLLTSSKKSEKIEYNNLKRKIEIKSKLLDENDITPKEFFQSFFDKKINTLNNKKTVNSKGNGLPPKIDELIQKGLFEEAHNLLFELYKNNPNNIRLLQYLTILAFIRNNIIQAKSLINLLEYKNPNNFTTKKLIDYYQHITKERNLSNDILVSAIVSVYNSEQFIEGCLEDLVNQTLYKNGNLEIIVVNSGSEQNEEKIILNYKNKYKNIVYIKTEQRETIYQAWNRAIKIAKGKYITNANTDDRHSEIAFEKMLNAFQINPAIDVVYANDYITNVSNDTFDSNNKKEIIKWSNFVKEFLLFGCFIGPHPMWKKSLHDKFGYFDESLKVVGDYEFWLRISQNAMFYHLNEILGLYYYSENSVEHKNKKLTNEENKNVQKKYILKYIPNIQELNKIENLLEQIKNYSNLKDYYDLAKNLIEKRKNGFNLQSLIYYIITNFKDIINLEMGDDLIADKLTEIDSIIENNNYIIDNEVINIYNQFKENYYIIKSVN